MEYVATSSLAKELDIKSSDLFDKFKNLGWIERKNDKWVLTELGKKKGGQIRTSEKFGDYIVWPHDISIDNLKTDKSKLLNATSLGKHFNISSQRMNLILSELGWIEKKVTGWIITNLGKNIGGKQLEHETSGGSYVLWPESILSNKNLVEVFNYSLNENDSNRIATTSSSENTFSAEFVNFRDKFEAKQRTKDGHFVRSRAEALIDNALYDYGLVHAYEKKAPIAEDLYTDFYLPSEKVYIEYWGLESDPKYLERKKKKLALYEKYQLKLLELVDSDIENLDDHLPKKLLKFGIKIY